MLIAHLPAGFILGTIMRDRPGSATGVMAAALIGSVFPDFDLFYFYLVDGGHVHHHAYVTHWPLFWIASGLVAMPLVKWLRPQFFLAAMAFFLAAMIHMALDTVASPIQWLMPFDVAKVELANVPARFDQWLLSFVFHWTFAIEIAICGFAGWLAVKESGSGVPRENRT
jgi:inner membrane protein